MTHELGKITPGRFYYKVKMISHTYVREEDYTVYLQGEGKLIQE